MSFAALSPGEKRTLTALARSLAPPSSPAPLDAERADVAGQLENMLQRFEPASRRRLRALLRALQWAPLAAGCRHRLAGLSPAEEERFLERALRGHGPTHTLVVSLRALCLMVLAGDPRFRSRLGDDNRPLRTGLPIPEETPLRVFCHPELRAEKAIDCDVAIVGSGAGGATIARELACAGLDVAIFEEGGPVRRSDFAGRALERTIRYYRANGLTTTLGRPIIPVPMGCVVGGTTVVNSGTCLRAPDAVLAEWARRDGAELAAPDRMARSYDTISRRLHVHPVSDAVMGSNGERVRRGAETLGLRGAPIPRPTRECAGSGQCAFGCPRDAKRAMHLTFLPEAVAHGARIYARCRVERLLTQGTRVSGLRARLLDECGLPTDDMLSVRARAVFSCAGALMTPFLLSRGLGLHARALGRHLRIHPGSGITALFDEPIRGWQGVMQSYAIEHFVEEGILLEATFPPLGMSYSAASLPGLGVEHAELLSRYDRMASIGSIVSDSASGRVRNVPGLGPSMFYAMNTADVARSVRATALAARVLFAAGASEVYPGIPAVPVLRSGAEVDALECRHFRASELKVSAYHPMGSARMGSDPGRSVCDPSGRVHGLQNLYVADTGLFPSSSHVNPQLTLMALCLELAERFLQQRPAG